MKITSSRQFTAELKAILNFYLARSEQASIKFRNDLFAKIESIPYMPYRFRKNKSANEENIRDLVFKGYVVVFRIDDTTIKILSIYRYNLPSLLEDEF
ncbi:type II toxin-antitoxin system RelE/ParE family toxin [Helicobacter sp. 11S02629-2]|uniref:type II toxin-antitoxin system RelE/ParE family toxin n=1 Tax=Helicobacter sp. 11S02629-2 TaxID=1476195 RepID=UPI000BA6BC5C|nr:type II toxin-antitoxin system RelE/ParE family toxin [Helicobacter sp. 11S02629-2]PAF45683.1 hypothetical protein BKH40_02040 [Helicobacter sp. 11S02629-2]